MKGTTSRARSIARARRSGNLRTRTCRRPGGSSRRRKPAPVWPTATPSSPRAAVPAKVRSLSKSPRTSRWSGCCKTGRISVTPPPCKSWMIQAFRKTPANPNTDVQSLQTVTNCARASLCRRPPLPGSRFTYQSSDSPVPVMVESPNPGMVPASGSGYNGWPIHAGSIYYYQPDDHYHQLNGRPPHPDRGQETRWEMPVKSIMKPCFAIWLICGLFGLAGHYLSPVHAMEPTASHAPLPYRIVSFHQGQADMELIKLARVAGYNGVQIQTERGTLEPLEQFAEYNQRTHLVENCHQLGMQVSIWIHELNDIPAEFLHKPDAGKLKPGEIVCNYEFAGDQKVVLNINDSKLWALLGERYDYILTKLIPDVDVLILTVTETQIHATNPELFVPLVRFLDDKCRKYGKRLAVRTFVWHPQDLNNLMTTIQKLPEDVMVMSKCVPQDWHLRSINATDQ